MTFFTRPFMASMGNQVLALRFGEAIEAIEPWSEVVSPHALRRFRSLGVADLAWCMDSGCHGYYRLHWRRRCHRWPRVLFALLPSGSDQRQKEGICHGAKGWRDQLHGIEPGGKIIYLIQYTQKYRINIWNYNFKWNCYIHIAELISENSENSSAKMLFFSEKMKRAIIIAEGIYLWKVKNFFS